MLFVSKFTMLCQSGLWHPFALIVKTVDFGWMLSVWHSFVSIVKTVDLEWMLSVWHPFVLIVKTVDLEWMLSVFWRLVANHASLGFEPLPY